MEIDNTVKKKLHFNKITISFGFYSMRDFIINTCFTKTLCEITNSIYLTILLFLL
jgi:hypothetical protein